MNAVVFLIGENRLQVPRADVDDLCWVSAARDVFVGQLKLPSTLARLHNHKMFHSNGATKWKLLHECHRCNRGRSSDEDRWSYLRSCHRTAQIVPERLWSLRPIRHRDPVLNTPTVILWKLGIVGNTATRRSNKLRLDTYWFFATWSGNTKHSTIDLYAAMRKQNTPDWSLCFQLYLAHFTEVIVHQDHFHIRRGCFAA
jgi:hypothetical protein